MERPDTERSTPALSDTMERTESERSRIATTVSVGSETPPTVSVEPSATVTDEPDHLKPSSSVTAAAFVSESEPVEVLAVLPSEIGRDPSNESDTFPVNFA